MFRMFIHPPTNPKHTHTQDVPMDLKNGCSFDANHFDKIVHDQLPVTPSYLIECRKTIIRHGNHPNHVESDDDVVIMSSPNGPPRPRMKLFQFHNNIRPPYFGSWQKKSNIVCGRNPFQKDKVCATLIHTYIHTYIHTHTHTHTYVHTRTVYTNMYYTNTYIHIYTHMYTRTYVHNIHTRAVHWYTLCMAYVHSYIYCNTITYSFITYVCYTHRYIQYTVYDILIHCWYIIHYTNTYILYSTLTVNYTY